MDNNIVRVCKSVRLPILIKAGVSGLTVTYPLDREIVN